MLDFNFFIELLCINAWFDKIFGLIEIWNIYFILSLTIGISDWLLNDILLIKLSFYTSLDKKHLLGNKPKNKILNQGYQDKTYLILLSKSRMYLYFCILRICHLTRTTTIGYSRKMMIKTLLLMAMAARFISSCVFFCSKLYNSSFKPYKDTTNNVNWKSLLLIVKILVDQSWLTRSLDS